MEIVYHRQDDNSTPTPPPPHSHPPPHAHPTSRPSPPTHPHVPPPHNSMVPSPHPHSILSHLSIQIRIPIPLQDLSRIKKTLIGKRKPKLPKWEEVEVMVLKWVMDGLLSLGIFRRRWIRGRRGRGLRGVGLLGRGVSLSRLDLGLGGRKLVFCGLCWDLRVEEEGRWMMEERKESCESSLSHWSFRVRVQERKGKREGICCIFFILHLIYPVLLWRF